jgi:hypothetical protein
MAVRIQHALVLACLLGVTATRTAHADSVGQRITNLESRNEKLRLAATIGLAQSREPRAILAVARVALRDSRSTVRRAAVLALARMLDTGASDVRAQGLRTLEKVRDGDRDDEVRKVARSTLITLNRARAVPDNAPSIFINVIASIDRSKRAPHVLGPLDRTIRAVIQKKGYAVEWPEGTPTQEQLTRSGSRAFRISAVIQDIKVQPLGPRFEVSCTVVMQVSPWSGSDAGEQWEAHQVASASGSARATTASGDRDARDGMLDCVEAVADQITGRQVVPFIRRLIAGG